MHPQRIANPQFIAHYGEIEVKLFMVGTIEYNKRTEFLGMIKIASSINPNS